MAAFPGQFIALQASNVLKDTLHEMGLPTMVVCEHLQKFLVVSGRCVFQFRNF